MEPERTTIAEQPDAPASLAAAEARVRRETLLYRITTAVRESLELNEVLETTVNTIGRSLDLCRCYVAFVDKQRQMVRVAHEYHVPEVGSTLGDFGMGSYGGELLDVMEGGEIFAVDDVSTDSRVAPFRDRILGPLGVRSLMYVPVFEDRRLVAVIGYSTVRSVRHWTDEEKELARAIADQVAVAMRQAQLYDRERRTARYRAMLNRISRAVRASLDLDTILAQTVEEMGKALGLDRCFVLAPGPFPPTLETSTVRFEYSKPGIASASGA